MLQIALAAAAAAAISYPATVVKGVDGDTLKVAVAGWPAPFTPIDVRVKGIDTPEHIKPPAKTKCEVKKGIAAMVFARQLVKAGDPVVITWLPGDHDKYGRLLGSISLPDGRDWGQVMVTSGFVRPYDGGAKSIWC